MFNFLFSGKKSYSCMYTTNMTQFNDVQCSCINKYKLIEITLKIFTGDY